MSYYLPISRLIITFSVIFWCNQCPAEWISRIKTIDGEGVIQLGRQPSVAFLEFGRHSYTPEAFLDASGNPVPSSNLHIEHSPVALFQGLAMRKISFPAAYADQQITVIKRSTRDAFWDQVIAVDIEEVDAPRYKLVEAGHFGESLALEQLPRSKSQIALERQSHLDPHISPAVDHEIPFEKIAALAYPLDFQKVLIASAHDPSPGFAFQNGQWLTTWLSNDLPKWTKEDRWFAPALRVGDKLIVPAPLSARTSFLTLRNNRSVPVWKLEWKHNGIAIQQTIFSHTGEAGPHVYVELRMTGAPKNARLALGVGRRPNVHYWDDASHERTPVPFFTLSPGYQQTGRQLIDRWNHTILESANDFEIEEAGPAEMLITFEADKDGVIHLRTPQQETKNSSAEFLPKHYVSAKSRCENLWLEMLEDGAQASLPSDEWMKRIDIWRTQLQAITRVNYQGQDRLSYGAYFYQAYFGPEEGWSTTALAQWGHGDEAKRQAELMLSEENRNKENVHHQSRNGAFGWYAAEVARLTNDRRWLERVAPALVENAEWTIAACDLTKETENPVTRGLLPPHIYGGDIRDPATSLYATAVCWKGLAETGAVLRDMAGEEYADESKRFLSEADHLKARLGNVIKTVAVHDTKPPFIPLALALPSLEGKNEGPYERLTKSRLGNYWNLFAPSVLELGMVTDPKSSVPNTWLLGYMERHGGLWAGLPRFHEGLDAAYSIGVINELISRSMRDGKFRNQALAALESFFLHAASRNGYTIPEVAGLFPYRLDRTAYEQLVRESPWNFGMYSAERYIDGHISFTEPLGAGAGEALWLIRNALVAETRDQNGILDDGIFLLSTVPSSWYEEGKEIHLRDFPTYYGRISVHVESNIDSQQQIEMQYDYKPNGVKPLRSLVVRFAPLGRPVKDIRILPKSSGTVRADFGPVPSTE